jgi:hypothetical protein
MWIKLRQSEKPRRSVIGEIAKTSPETIPQFSPNASLDFMRQETGKVSEEAVSRAASKIRR